MIRFLVAYIDPGTGALLLQFLLGGIAGLAAFLKFRWKSIKSRFSRRDDSVKDSAN